MTRVLLVTNDFPPRAGGIQSFVYGMAKRLPVDHLVVYSSRSVGWREFDAAQPFEVIRAGTSMLLPNGRAARETAAIARRHDCDAVWFGAAAPLGLLAAGLKGRTGVRRAVAATHGHEAGWAVLPAARSALRRIGHGNDVITYLADYTKQRLAPVLADVTRLERLTFGVDSTRFHPDVDATAVRRRYGLDDRPVIVCVSRLVPRKGQDTLIDTLPMIRRAVPDATLLLAGAGPYGPALRRRAVARGVGDHVIFTGPVADGELPAHYTAGDVFAMPCRTRRGGLDVEGLGVVFLEAAACGLPVVAGRSGGAPDTVQDGRNGRVVDGRDRAALSNTLIGMLRDRDKSAALGRQGREWVQRAWSWDGMAERLAGFLRA